MKCLILAYTLWKYMHRPLRTAWRIAGDNRRANRYLELGY